MARTWFVLRVLRTPKQPSKEEEGSSDETTSKRLTDEGSQANKEIASASVAEALVGRKLLERSKEQDRDTGESTQNSN
jgi:hypothetical protein